LGTRKGAIAISAVVASSFTAEGRPAGQPLNADNPLLKDKRLMEISVADTGIGITAEDRERIFDPFEQVDSSLSRRYQGSGLGLALTKRLIELHGGLIWVGSEGP
jgi:signal transduction histidine kinase